MTHDARLLALVAALERIAAMPADIDRWLDDRERPQAVARAALDALLAAQQAEKFNVAETLSFITEMKDAVAHIATELRAVKAERDTLLAICKEALPLVEEYLQGIPEFADKMQAAIARAEATLVKP